MAEKKKTSSTKKSTSAKKYMDVAKPGKTTPSASSRPVIVGHRSVVKDPMVSEDKKMPPEESNADEHKINVKRTGPKVIAPLNDDLEAAKPQIGDAPKDAGDAAKLPEMPALPIDAASEDVTKTEAPEAENESSSTTTDESSEKPTELDFEKSETDTSGEEEPSNDQPEDDKSDVEPDVTTTDEHPQEDDTAEEDSDESADEEPTSSQGSDESKGSKGSSIVDTIAGEAAKNKEKKADDKKSEEIKKRLEAIEKLVEDKKYYVKTSTTTKKERKTRWVILLLSILLLAAGYLAIDAQLVKNDYWLPHHFFKEETQKPSTDSVAKKDADNDVSAETPSENEAENSAVEPSEEGDSSPVQVRARDTERKNELKDLQQQLETYFNDNGSYPDALSGLTPAPTEDELTGPKGDAYTYTVTDDKSSYVLKADLENDEDPDADSEGFYVLNSVN